jgi:cytochrome c6
MNLLLLILYDVPHQHSTRKRRVRNAHFLGGGTMKKLAICLMASASTVALVALSVTAAKADSAEATYKAKCQMCHGPDGKGETPTGKAMKVKAFSSEDVQKMSDADLVATITNGKGKMPAYKALTPDQVKELVSYIRSLGKKK